MQPFALCFKEFLTAASICQSGEAQGQHSVGVYSGRGESGRAVVPAQNTVPACIIISSCVIFHVHHWKPAFALLCSYHMYYDHSRITNKRERIIEQVFVVIGLWVVVLLFYAFQIFCCACTVLV